MIHWSFPDETHVTYHYAGYGIIDEESLGINKIDKEPITIKDIKNDLISKENNMEFDIVNNTNYLNFEFDYNESLLGATMSLLSNKCCIFLKDKNGNDGIDRTLIHDANMADEMVYGEDHVNSENQEPFCRSGKFFYDKIRIHILQ
jgi:hypothetical protein